MYSHTYVCRTCRFTELDVFLTGRICITQIKHTRCRFHTKKQQIYSESEQELFLQRDRSESGCGVQTRCSTAAVLDVPAAQVNSCCKLHRREGRNVAAILTARHEASVSPTHVQVSQYMWLLMLRSAELKNAH